VVQASQEVDEGREALRLSSDDREGQRQAERGGSDDGLRCASDRDPDRERVLDRAWPHGGVLERRPVAARPCHAGGVADLHQQLELLGEELVVVVEVVAEQREGLDEGASTGHDLRSAAGQQVDVGEVLEDTDGVVGAQDGDGARQADAVSADGDCGEDGRGRGDEVVRPVVLSDREEVEAELVGELCLL
jgi:hypothetical protein